MPYFPRGLALAAIFAASGAAAGSVEQRYVAYSTTAMAITGDIVLGEDAITFGNGVRVGLAPAGTRPGADWQQITTTDAPVHLFRMAADPGELIHGNTLCGGMGPATYLGVQRPGEASGADAVSLSVFAGAAAPRTVSDRLCGTFNFGTE
jgi:hypothetical protein